MARAYQEAHVLENLTSSVKALQAAAAELGAAKNRHEKDIKTLLDANAALEKKNAALEIRVRADEHNTAARVANSHLAQSNDPNHALLTKLHDVITGRPIRNFPKHERDVKTMGQSDVIQILQALDIKTLGLGGAEKKAVLREQIGLVREASVTGQ